MNHPYQNIEANGRHLFCTVKNNLQVFEIGSGKLVGHWTDPIDTQETLTKKFQSKIETTPETEEEPVPKKGETNSKKPKKPKVPVPGPGAPPIYNYIRSLELTNDSKHLIATTDSDKSIVIFKLDFNDENCLTLIKRQVFPKRPCSISVADDNTTVIVGDKFGDVYKIGIDDEVSVAEKSLKPILGHVSMLTDVLITTHNGKQFILTSDRDEHIKVSNYPTSYVVKHWLFGHDEFIASMVQPEFNKELLVTGGGDDNIFLWNWIDNKLLSTFNMRGLLQPYLNDSHFPPERFLDEDSKQEITVVRIISYKRYIIVLAENVKLLLSLVINEDLTLSLHKKIDLENPNVDICLSGSQLLVSADSQSEQIQAYDAESLEKLDIKQLNQAISSANPCKVNSREEFYPLYNMNSLRKRSEH